MIELSGGAAYHFHVPKMGGRQSARLLRHAGLITDGVDCDHEPVESPAGVPVIAGVRDPLDWMLSLWCHRRRHDFNWQLHRAFEARMRSSSLERFLKNVAGDRGSVLRYFRTFVGSHADDLRLVRLSHLVSDLEKAVADLLPDGQWPDGVVARVAAEFAHVGAGAPAAWVQREKPPVDAVLAEGFRSSQLADFVAWTGPRTPGYGR